MSALGHSLPMRLVSASHDVRSTPKADMRFQRNICSDGPKADSCTAAKSVLFDHLVGAGEECRRYLQANCFRGPEVDHQLKFR
jgi:hypothetical protein